MIHVHAFKPSWQALAIAEETADVRADLQERLASQTLCVQLSGADLLAIQRATAAALSDCDCEHCSRARSLIAESLHRLQVNDLDRDRIRRLINPADRWHPGLTAAAQRPSQREDGQGGAEQ